MSSRRLDLDEALGAWVAQHRLASYKKAALRDAVVLEEVTIDVTSHHWWSDFTRTVIQNTLLPTRLRYNSTCSG